MVVGNNLKLLRKHFGKSQDEVSKSLGLNRSTYSGYENAVAQPSLEIISMISEFYNISIDAILKNDFSTFNSSQWTRITNGWKSSATGSKLRILTSQVSESNEELIEMIPVKAKAGYALGYSDPEFIKELPTIRLPFLSKNRKYRTFPISGDSMPPVSDGSFVVGEFVSLNFPVEEADFEFSGLELSMLVDWGDTRDFKCRGVLTGDESTVIPMPEFCIIIPGDEATRSLFSVE